MPPCLPWDAVEAVLEQARQLFIERDRFLIEVDANERSMTFRFAAYLQHVVGAAFDVDAEYNRVGNERGIIKRVPKRFFQSAPIDDTSARTIYPDIIIHKRGEHLNCVVIEAKKEGENQKLDELKLAILASEYGHEYEQAVLLTFLTDDPFITWERLSTDRINHILEANGA